jgi:hypothetical protein
LCENAAGDVKDSRYNNKRNPNPNHGYLNPMVEQVCGEHGPGSPGWGTHSNELTGAERRLRPLRVKTAKVPNPAECGIKWADARLFEHHPPPMFAELCPKVGDDVIRRRFEVA